LSSFNLFKFLCLNDILPFRTFSLNRGPTPPFRMTQLQNLANFDPFDVNEDDVGGSVNSDSLIHIRIQQRNGRKTLTTVQGIAEKFDKKRIVKALKKQFACNGTVIEHPEYGEVIQLQGDQRAHVQSFLLENGLGQKETLKIHGF